MSPENNVPKTPENKHTIEYPEIAQKAQSLISDYYYFSSTDCDMLAGRSQSEWAGMLEIAQAKLLRLVISMGNRDQKLVVGPAENTHKPIDVLVIAPDGHNLQKVRELSPDETFTGRLLYSVDQDLFLKVVSELDNGENKPEFISLGYGTSGAEFKIINVVV